MIIKGGTWLESTAPTTSAPRRGVTRPLQSSIRWENHTFDTFEWFSTNFSLTLTWNCTCTGRATCVESSSRGSRTLTSTWWECTAWPKTTSPHWVADWTRFWAEEEWQLHPAYYWSRIVLIEKKYCMCVKTLWCLDKLLFLVMNRCQPNLGDLSNNI